MSIGEFTRKESSLLRESNGTINVSSKVLFSVAIKTVQLTLLPDHDDTCDIWRPIRLDEHFAVSRPRRMDALATFQLSGKTSDVGILA